ncbi:hypothetical protein RHMOL_Rhmol08G0088400 [Rhododendron molle]|uniref:Uncharacterized protein n=1 Tax=Rhododendron molle TaxID=49168 RepID=A0ACC0ML41_RHOML|nr:hypothetical protein RHMOL_Rhmol08G0088400 [Rhododendron molle]
MVRSLKSHHEEEEEDEDEEFVSRTTDATSHIAKADGKGTGQKGNAPRSKHSETEQRRRCKINERHVRYSLFFCCAIFVDWLISLMSRFQMLKDLLPQNDQKRDKASLLLEVHHPPLLLIYVYDSVDFPIYFILKMNWRMVIYMQVIEYVQFLQEKLQLYEGPYQGWTQVPSKLMPWKSNSVPVESFMDPSQLMRNGSGQEDNTVVMPAMLSNARNSAESDLGEADAYDGLNHPPMASNQATPSQIPLQSGVLEDMHTQSHQTSVSSSGQLASQSQSQFWQVRQSTTENAVPSNALGEQEELKVGSAEASFSNAYSQGLLNTLTQALQSLGVDLSQASISVQLDVGKRANTGPTTTFGEKDPQNHSPGNQLRAVHGLGSSYDDSGQAHKRLRTELN